MKKLFFLLTLIIPFMANAIKIATNEIDEFTGKPTIITSWEGFNKSNSHIRFRYQNDKLFVDFKTFYDGSIVVTEGSSLKVKSDEGNITSFQSVGTYTGGRGCGAVGLAGSAAWGIDVVYTGDIAWFINNKPVLMRLYTTDGYMDKRISEKDGVKIQQLAELFIYAINNKDTADPLKSNWASCKVQYLRKSKKSYDWDVVKEEELTLKKEDIQRLIDEWKSQESTTYDYDVKITKQK